MRDSLFFSSIIAILILTGAVLISYVKEENPTIAFAPPKTFEYYFSINCPGCVNVDNFLGSWEGKDKIFVEKIEVKNSETAKKFYARGVFCEFEKNELGLPLLVTPDVKCFTEDFQIIEHLESL